MAIETATVTIRLAVDDLDELAQLIAEKLRGQPVSAPTPAEPLKLLWREDEAAAALGVSALSLKKWRSRGLIRAASEGRPVLYDKEGLERIAAWLIGNSGERDAGNGRHEI
jgi:hypothetical protein